MRFSSWLNGSIVVIAWFVGGSAFGSCFECDDVVDLDQGFAQCYLQQYDDIVSKISISVNGFARVDLGGCDGKSADGWRSIASMPVPGSIPSLKLKSVYTFDLKGAQCLKELLVGDVQDLDPVTTFELYRLCE